MYISGYDTMNGVFYMFQNCRMYNCPHCNISKSVNETQLKKFTKKWDETIAKMEETFCPVEKYRLCQFYQNIRYWIPDEMDFLRANKYSIDVFRCIENREFFYGGRTEVFSPYCKKQEGEEILYYDVTSLYPYICAFREMPIGFPEILYMDSIDTTRCFSGEENEYWGFIKCIVIPNKYDQIGILPSYDKKEGKLLFNLYDKVGTWHTCELKLALENGYRIARYIQVYHWSKENRSSDLFKGYMNHMIRGKQECEGWEKYGLTENSTLEEKNAMSELLFQQNGGIAKIRVEKVKNDKTMKASMKSFANCLWGKFGQKDIKHFHTKIHSYSEYLQFMTSPEIDVGQCTFRYISENTFFIKYQKENISKGKSLNVNAFIASTVTSFARELLIRKILSIEKKEMVTEEALANNYSFPIHQMKYCDTDSIIFNKKQTTFFQDPTEQGLGKFISELAANKVVEEAYLLAAKSYALFFVNKTPEDAMMKAKGFGISLENRKKITQTKLMHMIKEAFFILKSKSTFTLDNFNIYVNSLDKKIGYGVLCSKYSEKKLGLVITKRCIVPYFLENEASIPHLSFDTVYTLPWGHKDLETKEDLQNLSMILYHEIYLQEQLFLHSNMYLQTINQNQLMIT
jgi:hypothetical protein